MRMRWLILIAVYPSFACAGELGRLFFTPAQRAQLEYEYARNVTTIGDTGSVLMLNGIVQRRGGARTVWINGVPQKAGRSDERSPAAEPVTVPGRARPIEIKVGQKVMLEPAAPPQEESK